MAINGNRDMIPYYKEFGCSVALYVVLLFASNYVMSWKLASPMWRIPVTLLPMIGMVATAWAIMRHLNRLDEMQRKHQFDVISMSFLGTALITFGYGFLESVGFPKLSMFSVWPIMAVLWGVGSCVVTIREIRRFRSE